MSINVQLPPFIPVNLAPTTESARRDNQLREVIPQLPAGSSSRSDNNLPSERNPSRNVQKDSQYAQSSSDNAVNHQGDRDNGKIVTAIGEQSQQGGSENSGQQSDQNDDRRQNQFSSVNSSDEQKQQSSQQVQEQLKQEQIASLSARHQEVVAHEQAHRAIGGQFAGAVSYEYQKGPDGRSYAVAGEVGIDISPVPGDPQATVQKMQQVRRAALAPASPSSADRMVAAQATRLEQSARLDMVMKLASTSAATLGSESGDDTPLVTEVESRFSSFEPDAQLKMPAYAGTEATQSSTFIQAELQAPMSVSSGTESGGFQDESVASVVSGEMELRRGVITRRYLQSYQQSEPAQFRTSA